MIVNDDSKKSTPRCVLTPRCFSCKKIQTKITNFISKNYNKQKNMHLLEYPSSMRIVTTNKKKYKFNLPFQCLQQPIESSYPESPSLNVQLYKEIMPPLANKKKFECANNIFNECLDRNINQFQNEKINQSQNKKANQSQIEKNSQFQNKKMNEIQNKNIAQSQSNIFQFQNKKVYIQNKKLYQFQKENFDTPPFLYNDSPHQTLFPNKKSWLQKSSMTLKIKKSYALKKSKGQIKPQKSNSQHKEFRVKHKLRIKQKKPNIKLEFPIKYDNVKCIECSMRLHSKKKDAYCECNDVHYCIDNSPIYLFRKKEKCNWCIHARQISYEVSETTLPFFNGYENVSPIKSKNSQYSKSLKHQFDTSEDQFLQLPSSYSVSNFQKVEIKTLPPSLDLSSESQRAIYINETSNTFLCDLFIPCKICHCYKVQNNTLCYPNNFFCKICSCHQNIQNQRFVYQNSKLNTLQSPTICYTNQIVDHIDTSSMKFKQEDSSFVEYNLINQLNSDSLHQNIQNSKEVNSDIMFKWTTSNHSQIHVSSCSMVATRESSRIPSPRIEVKSQSKSPCENVFLKQTTSPMMHIQATQCPTPTPIDITPQIGDVGNCHENNICKFETKCNLGKAVPPIQIFNKIPTSIQNERHEVCGQPSKPKNQFLETDLLSIHSKKKYCLEYVNPSIKCAGCKCHNKTKNQISIPPIPFTCQSNSSKGISSSQNSSLSTSSYQSSRPLSSSLFDSQCYSTCRCDTQSVLSYQRKLPAILSCQSKSPSISCTGSSSRPISSYGTYTPIPYDFSSSPCSFPCFVCESSKCTSRKHIHSPQCAKGELQDPPCPSQQYQLQYEDFGASNQNFVINDKPICPPSAPPSLCQPDYSCESEFLLSLPSVGVHNCCCGKCKGEEYELKNPKRCIHCGHFHSCCCGMCLCPNSFCPRSPNYGLNILSPINLSRQEMAFKHQRKRSTRPVNLNSQNPQKKEFNDHYARCCVFQDYRSRRRSYPHNTKNHDESNFFQPNSNAENYVLQPLSIYRTRPHNKITTAISQCQSRTRWPSIVWSPMTIANICCCQKCLNGEPCTSKQRD